MNNGLMLKQGITVLMPNRLAIRPHRDQLAARIKLHEAVN